MITLRLTVLGLACIAATIPLDAGPSTEQLLNCSISTSGVAFGNYSVFSASPTVSTGTVNYSCTLGILVRVELSRGSSATFNPRTLKNGTQILNYNLFLDSGYTTIWGDGSGTTGRITQVVTALFPHAATVYGRIPAQQNAVIGGYTDSVTATIVF